MPDKTVPQRHFALLEAVLAAYALPNGQNGCYKGGYLTKIEKLSFNGLFAVAIISRAKVPYPGAILAAAAKTSSKGSG